MNILITGAAGFVGKNLTAALKNLRDGKDRTRQGLTIAEIYEYDLDTDPARLVEYCRRADFVFHLAGVNRPRNNADFMTGNFGFSSRLLDTLKSCGNTCPVMLCKLRPFKAVQAPSLIPRFQMTVHSFMTSCSKVSRLMALLFTDER